MAPEDLGAWSEPIEGPNGIVGVHAVLLHTGEVLLWDAVGAFLWDHKTGKTTVVGLPDVLFCAGQVTLADGRCLAIGGRLETFPGKGPRYLYLFDPEQRSWTRGPDMARGRWYPTGTVLADGSVAITSGTDEDKAANPDIEIYNGPSVTVVGSKVLRLYPRQQLLPNGRIALFGPPAVDCGVFDASTWAFEPAPGLKFAHSSAPGVLLPGGPSGSSRMLVAGGQAGDHALSDVETRDFADPTAPWTRTSMPEPRAHMNLVLLPDGTVLGVGGDEEVPDPTSPGVVEIPHLEALLHDPNGLGDWQPMAAQAKHRGYHSTAVLLPDGRVLSAGDTATDRGHHWLEVYSPPYLFKGPRPVINSVPKVVTYGRSFSIATDDAVGQVVLMRPGATTHATDMNQRHVSLQWQARAGRVVARAPSSGGIAPPGYHMLFLLSPDGVPSKASWVRLGVT